MSLLMVAVVGFCLDAPHCSAQEPKERANRDARGEVLCMAITLGGQTLATGTWDRITLWSVETGKELYTLNGHEGQIACVAFSPDAKVLASGGRDKVIKFWDVATGKELRTLTGHTERVASLAFSPDGKTLVSGSWDKTIKMWDAGTGEELRTLTGLGGRRCVVFSSDGRSLVSDDDRTVIVWDFDSGKERVALKGHLASVFALSLTPDGKILASGGDDFTVKLWDAATGRELRTLKGHTDAVGSLAFTADGKTLASGEQRWDGKALGCRHGQGTSQPSSKERAEGEASSFRGIHAGRQDAGVGDHGWHGAALGCGLSHGTATEQVNFVAPKPALQRTGSHLVGSRHDVLAGPRRLNSSFG
jgi:tricorn protease-like protein